MRAWERAIIAGRPEDAARLFADGAKVPEGVLDSHDTAVAWNHSVVCWGKIATLDASGARVQMTLVVGRPRNVACPPRGSRLKVVTQVRNGKIVSWQYVVK